MPLLNFDSVTTIPPEARGRAAIAASHGGEYAAYCAAKAGVKAVILCDAGVGRERAGIGGLSYLDRLGVAAAGIGHHSARIGDGEDCFARGIISYVNNAARKAGVIEGMLARAALEKLEASNLPASPEPPPMYETRHEITDASANGVLSPRSTTMPISAPTMPASRACPRSVRATSRAPPSAPGARASATDNRPIATDTSPPSTDAPRAAAAKSEFPQSSWWRAWSRHA